ENAFFGLLPAGFSANPGLSEETVSVPGFWSDLTIFSIINPKPVPTKMAKSVINRTDMTIFRFCALLLNDVFVAFPVFLMFFLDCVFFFLAAKIVWKL